MIPYGHLSQMQAAKGPCCATERGSPSLLYRDFCACRGRITSIHSDAEKRSSRKLSRRERIEKEGRGCPEPRPLLLLVVDRSWGRLAENEANVVAVIAAEAIDVVADIVAE